MGGTCSKHGGDEKFLSEDLKGRHPIRDRAVKIRIILKRVTEIWLTTWDGFNRWRALVNTVMNLKVPQKGLCTDFH
jgi:hypothetical protein